VEKNLSLEGKKKLLTHNMLKKPLNDAGSAVKNWKRRSTKT